MLERLLVANRGEIALRIVRAAHDLGIGCVAVHATDDAESPHVGAADAAVALAGAGPAAYLDIVRIIDVARAQGCDAVHPGYGFLSERADFASACADAGLIFVGPTPAQLALFEPAGDAERTRAAARRIDPDHVRPDLQRVLDRVAATQDAARPEAVAKRHASGGRPFGVFANNPQHLGGAIDPDAADKASRFMQLCEAHGLPILSLCDTPGFMVGPEIERQAQVRHACRMFVNAARLTVPCFTVVIRKGYGLGAQAMALGGFDAPVFTVAWPTGEFGAMGLEGAVQLGFRKELEAAAEGPEREALYRQLVERQYANGSAIHMATTLEIDAVIDPAHTRDWLLRGLDGCARRRPAQGRRFIDGW